MAVTELATDDRPPFCFACGTQSGETDICDCGAPIEHAFWKPSPIGSVYQLKGIGRKVGVVVEAGDRFTLVTKPGKTTEISRSRLDKAELVLDMSPVPSDLFRLYSISERQEEWARGIAAWLQESNATNRYLADWPSKRLFARSAIAASRRDLAEQSGLSETEIDWLQMHAASAAGAHATAVDLALALPVVAYSDKASVVLSAVANASWNPTAEETRRVSEWPLLSIESKALRAVLGLELDLEDWEEVLAWLNIHDTEDRPWLELMIAGELGQPLSGRDQKNVERVAAGAGEVSLAERVLAAGFGAAVSLSQTEVDELEANAPSVVDDLVDRGSLYLDGKADELAPELRARVAPGALTTSELEDLDHSWELARRNYVSGGRNQWPEGSAGDHYRALFLLRSGDTSSLQLIADESGVAAAVATTVDSGSIEPEILNDPTTWDTVARHVDLTDELRNVSASGPYFLQKSYNALLSWDWDTAIREAKSALKSSNEETVRDEALNIIAFLRYQSEEDESAVTALERALDGEYTQALQANAGIVAEHLAPEKAAYHLGRLASEAPSTDLKLAAVRRAFRIWNTGRLAWEEESDLPDAPRELLSAVRELATADIELVDFVEVMRLISSFDEDWLAEESNTDASPHSDSWERRVYVAKSGGDPESYIEAVTAGLDSGYDADWLIAERDSMVEGLRSLIFEDIEHLGPATYAFIAIDKGLPMSDWNRVVLSCGALVSICRSLVSQEGLPSDQIVRMFDDAKELVPGLEPDEQSQVGELIRIAGNSLAHAIGVGREELLRQGYEALGSMLSQLKGVPLARINWTKMAEALRPLRDMANESIRELNKAKAYTTENSFIEAVDSVIERFQELRDITTNPRRALS